MKKKLVFHFYFGKDWKSNRSVYIHLACLKHYCHVFDEIFMAISVDNTEDEAFVNEIKHLLLDYLDTKALTFTVVKNTVFRECATFYDEIIKGNREEGVVFFAHNKGYTNICNEFCDKEQIVNWILGLYFLNIEFLDEVEEKLTLNGSGIGMLHTGCFYGSFLSVKGYYDDIDKYCGCFYWINVNKLKNEKVNFPLLDDRVYAENLPRRLKYYGCSSHNDFRLFSDAIDFYRIPEGKYSVLEAIKSSCTLEEFESFNNFKKEILSNEKTN